VNTHHLTQPILAIQNLPAAENPTAFWVELGLSILVITVGIVSLVFWAIAVRRLVFKQELIPYRRSECVLGFFDVAAIFVCWLGAQIASGAVLVAIKGPNAVRGSEAEIFEEHGVPLLYLSAMFGIASFIVGGLYLVFRYQTTNSFGLRLGQLRQQVGYGVVVFTMLFPITLLIQFLLSMLVEYDHPILSVLSENPSFVPIFGCWAAAVFQAPLVEEFLFRGVFQHWLERLSVSKITDENMLFGGSNLMTSDGTVGNTLDKMPELLTAEVVETSVYNTAFDSDQTNPYQPPNAQTIAKKRQTIDQKNEADSAGPKFAYWPILVSSLCFALVHWGQGLAPIPLFILALGLGYLFRQTGSLIACVTVHFLLNFYSMLVFTIMILLGETP